MQELHYLAEDLFIPIIIITYFIVVVTLCLIKSLTHKNHCNTLHVLAHYLGK